MTHGLRNNASAIRLLEQSFFPKALKFCEKSKNSKKVK